MKHEEGVLSAVVWCWSALSLRLNWLAYARGGFGGIMYGVHLTLALTMTYTKSVAIAM